MALFRKTPPTAADLALLRKPIEGLPPVEGKGSSGVTLESLNPKQIHRLVELRKILQKVNVGAHRGPGQFLFTLSILQEVHKYIDYEENLVQRVAYKSTLGKIREDLLLLKTHQDELSDMVAEGASESVLERAHDDLEDKGQAIASDFRNLVSKLQADTLNKSGLAASSLYRSSLSNESRMYTKLDHEGGAMLRRWNDVRLEVMNLLATTNHDARAKAHLERMLRDLDEILRYLDEYAVIPWLAPREVVAAIVVIDRRLNDYQDEYNLAQSDADRIANVIDDRETRDENRRKIGEKAINFLNYLGISRNISIGGAVRLARSAVRGASRTGRFVFRTLPTTYRSVKTSLRTMPQRVVQTARQVARGFSGLGRVARRGAGSLVGYKPKRSGDGVISVDLDTGKNPVGLGGIISRGYSRVNQPPGEEEEFSDLTPSVSPITGDVPSRGESPGPVVRTGNEQTPDTRTFEEAAGNTLRTPGSTATASPSWVDPVRGKSSLRTMMHARFDILEAKVDFIGSRACPCDSVASSRGKDDPVGEVESLRLQEEQDLLKAVVTSLDRIAQRLDGGGTGKTEGSSLGLLASVLQKSLEMKSWMGNVLKALGGWKLVTGSLSLARGLMSTIAKVGAPLLRLGGFAVRVLTGPIGALLGSGLAGWQIGKAIHEKYGMVIGDMIDASVAGVSSAIDWIKDKVSWVVDKLGMAKEAIKHPVESARKLRDASVVQSMEWEVKKYGGITDITQARAKQAGVDTSTYPTFSRQTGKVTPPVSSKPTTVPTAPPQPSRPSSTTSASKPAPNVAPPKSATPQTSRVSVQPPVLRSPSNSSSISPSASTTGSVAAGVQDQTVPTSSGQLYKAAPDANMGGLQPGVLGNFEAMVSEYKALGGRHPVNVNRAFASYEQQQAIFKKYGPGRAARPGRSAHNYGIAIDIDRAAANDMASMGLMAKYGFDRPVAGEPWHLQVAGVSAAMAREGIFSADSPSAQGGEAATASAGSRAPSGSQAPSVIAQAGTQKQGPSTKVSRETGGTPEDAAYDARTPAAAAAAPQSTQVSARSSNPSMPAGHGAARIPEFSFADPTFFALNLGALSA